MRKKPSAGTNCARRCDRKMTAGLAAITARVEASIARVDAALVLFDVAIKALQRAAPPKPSKRARVR